MDIETIKKYLKSAVIFSDLNEDQISQIISASTYKTIANNELIIEEDNAAKHIYLIISGDFLIYKNMQHENHQSNVPLGTLHQGDTVGELAFLDEQPRSANVKSIADNCAVLEIPFDKLAQLVSVNFYRKISKKLSNNLRMGNETIIENLHHELDQEKKLANMGRFITYVLLLISFYDLALTVFAALADNLYTSMFASTSVIIIFTLVLTMMIRKMGYPLVNYGFRLHRWQNAVIETLLFSGIFILLITMGKWLAIQLDILPSQSLIDMQSIVPQAPIGTMRFYIWFVSGALVYCIFTIFQEFISRGILQSSLQNFLQGKYKNGLANIVTSGVFAAMHIHLSAILALIVFVPSLFWGWLYIRQKSLLGPIISHILIGFWAVFILGLQNLLQ